MQVSLSRTLKQFILVGLMVIGASGAAFAAGPENWQMNFQPAVTPVMQQIESFHTLLLWLITAIAAFVLLLMIFVFIRFNNKANPEPQKFSHNTLLEVVWTAIPVLILVVIAIPSLRLLFLEDVIPEADFTIKATGYQWYWGYEYPDQQIGEFFANMVPDEELTEGQPRLLATDNPVVVPVGATVRVLVTGADVIHNWAMPPFGIKMDAVPGRINETWFRAQEEGTYYGQCSELCGQRHAFMPIEVHVVSQDEFDSWVREQGGTVLAQPETETLDVATTEPAAEAAQN
jgi:cytochrome c oxidase subunit 2